MIAYPTYPAVIVSHQGTSPGVDFTYTATINGPSGRPQVLSGLKPAQGRPADWDVVAAPPGSQAWAMETAPGRWTLFVQELPAVEECQ